VRHPFEPIGAQARWKTVYEILVKTPTGDIITYEQLGEALGLNPEDDRNKIVQALRRAAKEHEEHDKRAVDVAPGQGYRPVDPTGSLTLARRQQKKAGRSLVRGHSKAVNVDLNGVDPEVRKALEMLGHAFTLQMDFNRRFEGKQARLEQTIREIADSAAEDRKRTAEEVAELRERLARLEGSS
jgi:FKBP-type peptidyl-prolyl cis-trans isomerase 2